MNAATLVEPAWCSVPEYHDTFGPEVGDLAALAGFAPDPEQQLALDATFAVDKKGRSVAFEVALIACRQNIKTGFEKQAELGWLFITDERLVVHSAHEFRTAQEAFRDMDELVTGCDALRKRVKAIHRGNGDESIELVNGSRLIFKTRTKGGGRGLSGRKVVLDEGFALQPMHMGALLPTLSAQPDPQVIYGSSACLADSLILHGIVARGRAGNDPRLAYFEWCAPDPAVACDLGAQCDHAVDRPGCGCDKPELWQRGNTQMGRRISREYIAAERRALPPSEFGRERMGWHDAPLTDAAVSPLDAQAWADTVDGDVSNAPERCSLFGVEVDLDRAFASIGAAGRRDDGLLHIELVERQRGVGWLLERCKELDASHGPATFVVDGGGPAAGLIGDLEAAGLYVITAAARDVAAAAAGLVDAVNEATLRHGPQPELDAAVAGCRKRPLGDGGFAFGRRASDVDVTPLVAVALAAWLETSGAVELNVW